MKIKKKSRLISPTTIINGLKKIGKTAYEKCSELDLDHNRIELNKQHSAFIIESNDAAVLGYIGWAIEQLLDSIPTNLKPKFQKILENVKARKEDLERS